MSPGLPGTGIGGLFYICSALLMPLCEMRRRLLGNGPRRGTLVATQFSIALGVVTTTTGVFWGLDAVLNDVAVHVANLAAMTSRTLPLHVSAPLTTTGVLVAVLASVQVARLVVRLRRPRHAAG
jgi:hypothetical protein